MKILMVVLALGAGIATAQEADESVPEAAEPVDDAPALGDEEISAIAGALFNRIQTLDQIDRENEEWVCTPDRVIVCAPDGCAQFEPNHWIAISVSEQTYERCNEEACSAMTFEAQTLGPYRTFFLPDGASFAKMSRDGSTFVELISQPVGFEIVQSFGSCKAAEGDE